MLPALREGHKRRHRETMLRSGASKMVWLAKGAALFWGAALTLALVLGVATMALAAVPGDPFRLGQANTINALTRLTGNVNGAMLRIDNNSVGSSATALDLQVEPGKAPMMVNSATKVASFNADRLDNKDSRALGVTVKSAWAFTSDCAKNVSSPNECAPVTVKVPTGKHYDVTVLSSFAAVAASNTTVFYCSAVRTSTSNGCLNANSIISLAANYAESGASSGEAISLSAGTYTFYTD